MPWGKKEPGKHERKKTPEEDVTGRCGYTWSTRPPPNQVIRGVCYEHWCGLRPRHAGAHTCMKNWNCGETK